MLGSVKTDEYSFTQLQNSIASSNVSERISRYIGQFSDEKNNPSTLPGIKDKEEKQNQEGVLKVEDKAKTDKTKEEIDEEKNSLKEFKESNEPVDIFNDEETNNSFDISYGNDLSSLTRSFKLLAATVGSNDDKVTKSQLISLLQNLSSKNNRSDEFKNEIAFVKNLIAKFDTISEGLGYITSFSGVNDIQDYKTVTQEQVTPPIDLRI